MPKLRRMAFRLLTFVTEGFKKITASSAYMETLNLVVRLLSLLRSPFSVAN
jgi:hypothetical protein